MIFFFLSFSSLRMWRTWSLRWLPQDTHPIPAPISQHAPVPKGLFLGPHVHSTWQNRDISPTPAPHPPPGASPAITSNTDLRARGSGEGEGQLRHKKMTPQLFHNPQRCIMNTEARNSRLGQKAGTPGLYSIHRDNRPREKDTLIIPAIYGKLLILLRIRARQSKIFAVFHPGEMKQPQLSLFLPRDIISRVLWCLKRTLPHR